MGGGGAPTGYINFFSCIQFCENTGEEIVLQSVGAPATRNPRTPTAFLTISICLSVGTSKGGNVKAPKQHSIVKKQLQHL